VYTFFVKNVTFSLDEQLLARSRAYASAHQTTLNQLVRDLLERTVRADPTSELKAFFEWADESKLCSDGRPLTREEAHER